MKFNSNHCFLYKDNFNISNLIKKINKNYRLYFDNKHKIYFIVNIAKNNEICLKFYNFKQNVINNLLYSKVENSHKIFNEIDNLNKMIELKNKNNLIEDTTNKVGEINKFSKRLNHLSSHTINKILGADLC